MSFLEGFSLWQICLIIALLVIPILYQTYRPFKYYFKLFVYYISVLTIGTGVVFYALPRPRNPKNHEWVTFWVYKCLSPLLGIDIVIRGKENVKKDEPLIVVINHQSSLDMIPVFSAWPDNCVILAKKEIFWTSGTFGLGAWMCGTVYINRVNTESARKTMNSTSDLIKNKRLKVAVFPEGTRSMNGSMLPFKKGAFHLAVEGQVPIVPVVISSYENFYNPKEKKFDEGKVIIQFLPPIPTEGLTAADVTALTERTRDIMLECYSQISQEVKTLR